MIRFILPLLLFISFIAISQTNKNGLPFITNYSPKTYQASEQNWAITQDNRGVMYFGNNDNGILEYDGVEWRKIPLNNESIVRSLATDNNGIVYVGGVNEFGYLSISNDGKSKYHSLSYLIDSSKMDFGDVWQIFCHDSVTYFSSVKYLFEYKNGNLLQYDLPKGSLFAFNMKSGIYVANFTYGLYKFENKNYKLANGGDFFQKKGIYTLSDIGSRILVGTYPNGLFWYNVETGNIENAFHNSYINTVAKNDLIYHSSKYSSQQIICNTIYNGSFLINENGGILNHYNKANGLLDETVIYSYKDQSSNIWLALNNGIAKIEQNSPFRFFGEKQGIEGNIMDICRFKGKLFISTSLGVFYQENKINETPSFVKLKDITVNTWSILPFNHKNTKQLLVGTFEGLFLVNEDLTVEYIDDKINKQNKKNETSYIQRLYRSKKNPNKVFVAEYDGAFSIEFRKNKWCFDKEYPVKGYDIRHIMEDNDGNVWFATYFNGVIKSINADTSLMVYYGKDKGLPSLKEISIGTKAGEIVFGTKEGIWKYSKQSDSFYKDSLFDHIEYPIYFFKEDTIGSIWISAFKDKKKWIERYKKSNKGEYIKESTPFNRLPNESVDIIFHDDYLTYFGTSSGLYSFNNNYKKQISTEYHTLIRKVKIKEDSIIFKGTYFSKQGNLTLPTLEQNKAINSQLLYEQNDLTFEFAAPYFIEEQKTQYSYKLEGFNDTWSKWSSETKAIFTNLNEGDYTFKAKAKNIYGVESSVGEYHFSIAPPWYRTIVAYIFYFILSIFVISIIVKLYTHRLEQEKIRLEQIVLERTAEIRKQKDDIEHKNVVLERQKSEILKQKEEITSSIQYAQRIQKAIVPTEDMASSLLKDYFLLWKPRDIVSGDFWWLGEKEGYVVATAADCTGHGVPGAFMSMLGVSFLNEIVKQQGITNSGEILDNLREKVKTTLGQNDPNSTSKDGMDIALLVIDFTKMEAQFSGAYNPLYLFRNGELIEYKATRNPIAIFIKEKQFEQNNIELQKGDTLYLFSDGFHDQFGGEREKKYSTKRFKEYLGTIQKYKMEEQKEMLNNEVEDWMKHTHQIDDIIILGIRI